MTAFLESLSDLISNNYTFGIFLAFIAGMVTFFTPCSLSSIPLIITYVGGVGNTRKKSLLYAVFLAVGQTIVFITLGLIVALIGQTFTMFGIGRIWNAFLAALMVWMALEVWEVTNVLSRIPNVVSKVSKKGIAGAILIGMASSLFSTPCTAPVLTAILAYVSASGMAVFKGTLLLLLYSLGYSTCLIFFGFFIGTAKEIAKSEKFHTFSKVIKIILGILMLAFAGYLIYSSFYVQV